METPSTSENPVSYLVAMLSGIAILLIAFAVSVVTLGADVPPRISNSLSFNAKAQWLARVPRCDILVLGSSMALNNIDGMVLERAVPGHAVANAGSWGMRPNEDLRLLSVLMKRCGPRLVILPVYYGDFSSPRARLHESKEINWGRLGRTLSGRDPRRDLILDFDAQYLFDSYVKLQSSEYSTRSYYNSLVFDATGGVLFDDSGFNVDPKRWNGYSAKAKEIPIQNEVTSLRRLVKMARESNIEVLVVKMPLTSSGAVAFDQSRISGHWNTVRATVTSEGGEFIDLADLNISDAMFADFCHLKRSGAFVATAALVSRGRTAFEALMTDKLANHAPVSSP